MQGPHRDLGQSSNAGSGRSTTVGSLVDEAIRHQSISSSDQNKDRSPLKIGKGTYTAQLLYHGSAKSVDIQSRVLFVGPIPAVWIRKNRMSWTKSLFKGSFFDRSRILSNKEKSTYTATTQLLAGNTIIEHPSLMVADVCREEESFSSSGLSDIDENMDFDESESDDFGSDAEADLRELTPPLIDNQSDGLTYDSPLPENRSIDVQSDFQNGARPTGIDINSMSVSHLLDRQGSSESFDHRSTSPLLPVKSDSSHSIPNYTALEGENSNDSNNQTDVDDASFFTAHDSLSRSVDSYRDATEYCEENEQKPKENKSRNVKLEKTWKDEQSGGLENVSTATLGLNTAESAVDDTESLITVRPGTRDLQTQSSHRGSQTAQSSDYARAYLSGILERHTLGQNSSRNSSPQPLSVQKQQPTDSHGQVRFDNSEGVRSRLYRKMLERSKSKSIVKGKSSARKARAKFQNALVISAQKLLRNKKKGEIIMLDKMLVLVKQTINGGVSNNYNEYEYSHTRVAERWKEYIVVARNTGNEKAPVLLQFYKTRNVERIQHGKSSSSRFEMTLDKSFGINIYSTLDKTLALWSESKDNDSIIYILRTRREDSAMEWLAFFASVVTVRPFNVISISVPDLRVSADITISFEELKHVLEEDERDDHLTTQDQFQKLGSSPSLLRERLTQRVLAELEKSDYLREKIEQKWKDHDTKIGLAWRRYDRLEWVFASDDIYLQTLWAMSGTHDIELHEKIPYSHSIEVEQGELREEPLAIEGFLHRVTTWNGAAMSSLGSRLYWHTNGGLLFYTTPMRALPPHPSLAISRLDMRNEQAVKKYSKNIPLHYEITPFELNSKGNVRWIDEGDLETFEIHDRAAANEVHRRVSLISRSKGVIDLCAVSDVRICSETAMNVANTNDENIRQRSRSMSFTNTDFELIFGDPDESQLAVRLKAHNEECRDLWVARLRALMKYWTARRDEDSERTSKIRQENLKTLNIDEDNEAFLGLARSKWEINQGKADPYTYNISAYTCGRPVLLQGFLFQKPNKHASFRKYFVVVTQTELILYRYESQFSKTAKKAFQVNNEKYQTVPLNNCYIYSGPITRQDLLNRDRWFDKEHPGHHALPRVYSDGWKSAEDETLRCFALWFGRRGPIKAHGEHGLLTRQTFKATDKLGVVGRVMVFMTRSRQEREQWVTVLNIVIGRSAPLDDLIQEINLS